MSAGPTPRERRLLGLMAEAAGLTIQAVVDGMVRKLPGAPGLDELDAEGFAAIADAFVAIGFRHPALPLLTLAQRAWLDRCRRRLGLSGPAARAFYRESTGVAAPRLMTGSHFLGLAAAFQALGVAEPLPAPGFMDRRRASALRRTAWFVRVGDAELRERVVKFGGTTALCGLDGRAYVRVLASLRAVEPPPAPAVEGGAGMVTQPQANVIWRLWLDARRGADASDAALDEEIGRVLAFPGLDTLTRAGARSVINALTRDVDRCQSR